MLRSTSVTRIRASVSPRTVASPAKPIPTTVPRGPPVGGRAIFRHTLAISPAYPVRPGVMHPAGPDSLAVRRFGPARFGHAAPSAAPDEGAGRDVAAIGGVPPEHPGRSRFGAGQADADDPGGGTVARRVRVDRFAQQDPHLGHLGDRDRR